VREEAFSLHRHTHWTNKSCIVSLWQFFMW